MTRFFLWNSLQFPEFRLFEFLRKCFTYNLLLYRKNQKNIFEIKLHSIIFFIIHKILSQLIFFQSISACQKPIKTIEKNIHNVSNAFLRKYLIKKKNYYFQSVFILLKIISSFDFIMRFDFFNHFIKMFEIFNFLPFIFLFFNLYAVTFRIHNRSSENLFSTRIYL